MILLKNPKRCPQCFWDTVSKDLNKCTHCECRLMWPADNFAMLQREEWRHYWVFFKDEGWVHSDRLKDMKPSEYDRKPIEKPDKDYGKRPLPEGCSAE